MNTKIKYTTVAGDEGSLELSGSDLIEAILPDMRPPISNIIIEAADVSGKKVLISISPGGIIVHDAGS